MPGPSQTPRPAADQDAKVQEESELPESFPIHPALGNRVTDEEMSKFADSLSLADLKKLFERVANDPALGEEPSLQTEAGRISAGLNKLEETGRHVPAHEILDELDAMPHELHAMADTLRKADMHNEQRTWEDVKAHWEISNALNAIARSFPIPGTDTYVE